MVCVCGSIRFCDADNNFHDITREEVAAIQQAIIAHGQMLYQRKWELREAIGAAQDVDTLSAIGITFV